jgi:hypothetical protein
MIVKIIYTLCSQMADPYSKKVIIDFYNKVIHR